MPVSLQISLTPVDIPHAALILPHQLKVWAQQCAETLLVWDLDPGPRYRRQPAYRRHWDTCLGFVDQLNQALRQDWPELRILNVDSSEAMTRTLSQRFFAAGSEPLPAKDFRGGPYLAYFFALAAAKHDLVVHLDADMMFGGQSQSWIADACAALSEDPALLCIAPPGGPPPQEPSTRLSQFFTSRCFLLDRCRLEQALHSQWREPADVTEAAGWTEPFAELPETLLSSLMQASLLWRLNLPGQAPGMWSLHPPVPALPEFYTLLPQILPALEQEPWPAEQAGQYNLLGTTLEALKKSV